MQQDGPGPGANVGLRRAASDDAAMLHRWRAEPAVRRYQPIRQLPVATLASTLAERAALVIDPRLEGEVAWIIVAGAVPVGWITLRVHSRAHGVAELGYSLATAYHGRGFMRAALPQALAIAFDQRQASLYRLEARAAVTNIASRRVLEGAGFVQEGTARRSALINGERVDHALYAMLRDEWETPAAVAS